MLPVLGSPNFQANLVKFLGTVKTSNTVHFEGWQAKQIEQNTKTGQTKVLVGFAMV
jgi:hypothetical protein